MQKGRPKIDFSIVPNSRNDSVRIIVSYWAWLRQCMEAMASGKCKVRTVTLEAMEGGYVQRQYRNWRIDHMSKHVFVVSRKTPSGGFERTTFAYRDIYTGDVELLDKYGQSVGMSLTAITGGINERLR